MTEVVRVEHLTKNFGTVRAVDDISFTIQSGEIVGFIGPNGAGKSTTMRVLTGFLTGDHGLVHVLGHDVTRDPLAVQRVIGYLPESNPLYTDMRVTAFLQFAAEIRGIEKAKRAAAVDRAIQLCALEPVVRKRIRELSKGYRQRVGLAQAVVHRPPVLILDEPTEGLDPNQRVVMRELIQGFANDGATIILSTHILAEVERTCPRALMISKGRLVGDDKPSVLAQHHASLEDAFRAVTQTKE